jgi:hypothetical protein
MQRQLRKRAKAALDFNRGQRKNNPHQFVFHRDIFP